MLARISGALGLLVLCLSPAWAEDEPAQQPVQDPKVFVDAFEPLVAAKDWNTDFEAVAAEPGENREPILPGWADPAQAKGLREGYGLRASLPLPTPASLLVTALDFRTDAAARTYVATVRQGLRDAPSEPHGMEFRGRAFGTGAGAKNELPGFHLTATLAIADTTMPFTVQCLHVGTTAACVCVVGLPAYDRDVQDAFIARAVARLRDPDADADVPTPVVPRISRNTKVVYVHVVDPDGEAIPRATVIVRGAGIGQQLMRKCVQGLCVFGFARTPAALYVVSPEGEDGTPLPLSPVRLRLAGDAKDVTAVLPRGASITGRVLDAEGKPIAGVTVRASRSDHEPDDYEASLFLTVPYVTTDADGRFAVLGLTPGAKYSLWPHDPVAGYLPLRDPDATFAAGREDVELRIATTASIRVRVLDQDGQPVAGVRILAGEAKYADLGPLGQDDAVTTDASGVAEIPDKRARAEYELRLEPPETRRDLARSRAILLPRADLQTAYLGHGWSLRMQVRDAKGAAVEATVEARFGRRRRSDRSDKDGTCVLHHLPRETVQVRACTPPDTSHWLDDSAGWLDVAPTKDVVAVKAAHVETLQVQVVDAAARPVAACRLTVTGDDSAHQEQVRHGHARIRRPKEGAVIRVLDVRDAAQAPRNLAPGRKTYAGENSLTFRLTPGFTLTGRVVGPDGEPSAGVWVSAAPRGKRPTHRSDAETRTDAEGRFTLVGLAATAYEVRARHERYGRFDFVVATGGQEAPVEIRLRAK